MSGCQGSWRYWNFEHTIAVMQTKHGLARVAREFVLDLHADGVIYGELRWAPEQHLRSGLTLDETVEAVQAGIVEAIAIVETEGDHIQAGQLVTAMRHTDRGLEIAELAVRHRDNGVVGFDIAGPEAGFLPQRHKLAFDYLADQMFPATVHAGEADGIESIKDAIISGRALRLGHGVRIREDIELTLANGEIDLHLIITPLCSVAPLHRVTSSPRDLHGHLICVTPLACVARAALGWRVWPGAAIGWQGLDRIDERSAAFLATQVGPTGPGGYTEYARDVGVCARAVLCCMQRQ